MAHTYPLHQPVRATCGCCGIPYNTTFATKSQHVLCARCVKHQQRSASVIGRKDVEHVRAWQAFTDGLRSRHSETCQVLNDEIRNLKEEIATRDETIYNLRADVNALNGEMERVLLESLQGPVREPNERVINLLAGTVAEQANIEKEKAFGMRNSAFGRLWAVDELHHLDDDDQDMCVCGKRVDICPEFAALTPIRNSLYKWERAQVLRFDKKLPHGLPREHPLVREQLQHEHKAG